MEICDNYFCGIACFDNLLQSGDSTHKDHDFNVIELPTFAQGIPCHDTNCNVSYVLQIMYQPFTHVMISNYAVLNCFFSLELRLN
ncbi:unnamed protein product [Paramecium sonneborni]|uniref:Uncharacterized protein n=1 Tax=Paramecium sonneborni TaxID=65129 RepID=A0A8S1Q2E4_9CILI|nr:unnamed protein product [Paramecium sonneborni]